MAGKVQKANRSLAHSPCKILYDLEVNDATDTARPFDLWAAAEAVDAMCTSSGRSGTSKGIGESTLPKSYIFFGFSRASLMSEIQEMRRLLKWAYFLLVDDEAKLSRNWNPHQKYSTLH